MDELKRRAWLAHKQGLDGSLTGATARQVLKRAGWCRSVGGANPYLALFARAGLRRAQVDAETAKTEIHELPSARNCTYILPADDFALGLAVGQANSGNEMKVARKLGVTDSEIEGLQNAILNALKDGPRDPDAIREAVGDAARSLGAEGKSKGMTTTLPLALKVLQARGKIRRVPVNGRLDQQRYLYTLWNVTPEVDEPFTKLARLFFGWTGGTTAAEFQTFSGLGVNAAKAAIAPLGLINGGDGALMLPEDAEAYKAFAIPKKPQYALVGNLDGNGHLVARAEMPNHLIVDRGNVVGLWDFDPSSGTVVWRSFDKPDAAMKQAVAQMEAFVREDLGDARSFSLDSPQSRGPRLDALRKAAVA